MAETTVERRLYRLAAWRSWIGLAILVGSLVSGALWPRVLPEARHRLENFNPAPYTEPAPYVAPYMEPVP
jgi:hypothetical protein